MIGFSIFSMLENQDYYCSVTFKKMLKSLGITGPWNTKRWFCSLGQILSLTFYCFINSVFAMCTFAWLYVTRTLNISKHSFPMPLSSLSRMVGTVGIGRDRVVIADFCQNTKNNWIFSFLFL